jgi:hypothetical protein
MRITDSEIGEYFPPGDYIHMGKDYRVDKEDMNIPCIFGGDINIKHHFTGDNDRADKRFDNF